MTPRRAGYLRLLSVVLCLLTICRAEMRAEWVRHKSENQSVVVFVHGLMGDPATTWGTWPQMLVQDGAFDAQNVYVYRYPTHRFGSSPTINQLKTSMWSNLQADGVMKEKHIVFVCHSLGGVITRAFVLEHPKELTPKISFLYFFATPGSGASIAKLGNFISRNPQFEEVLPLAEGKNVYLDSQISQWRGAHLRIKSYCGYETKTLYGVLVVSEESATQLCTEPQQAFEEDHISIVKPVSPESETYKALKAALEDSAPAPPPPVGHKRPEPTVIIGHPPVGHGERMGGVTALDMGGSPSQEAIADPPNWQEPSKLVKLDFKDSALLTPEKRDAITRDISAFSEYLGKLQLNLPEGFPPIGVGDEGGSSLSHVYDDKPRYRSSENIGSGWTLDRRATTKMYVDWGIDQLLYRRLKAHPNADDSYDQPATFAFVSYFNWSFWNYKPANEGGYWATPLWEIRHSFGPEYADRLIGRALQIMVDNPEDIQDPDFDLYMYKALTEADASIESDATLSAAKIRDVIITHGQGIDLSAKPTLTFTAKAIKKDKGIVSVAVEAKNDTGLAAISPKIHLVIANGGARLLESPKHSVKDSTDSRETAIVVSGRDIQAHTASTLPYVIELGTDEPARLILGISYSCDNCPKLTTSPSLRFDLRDSGRKP